MTNQEILKELEKYDTPSITNVVATYPNSPLCLGLYNPWTVNWYTDQRIKCMYPELGPKVGYAVTCIYGLPDPNFNRLSFMDVVDALDDSPRPTILALQQSFPPEVAGKVGLAGGNMTSAMKTLGCLGCISNGPSRDIDEIRPMKFQYMILVLRRGMESRQSMRLMFQCQSVVWTLRQEKLFIWTKMVQSSFPLAAWLKC